MRHDRTLVLLLVILALAFIMTPLLADATNAPVTPPSEADDFNPGLGIFAAFMIMVMIVVFMLLLGIGLAVGIVLCALAGALAAFGILFFFNGRRFYSSQSRVWLSRTVPSVGGGRRRSVRHWRSMAGFIAGAQSLERRDTRCGWWHGRSGVWRSGCVAFQFRLG